MVETWGPAPGEQYVDGDDFVIAGLELGNVFVAIQPPRGYGENPVAIYHDPASRPPTTTSRPTAGSTQRADAIVHLGKHGTLEWLPGKALGLSNALRARRLPRRRPALLSVRRQRPRRGHAGQAPRPRRRRSTTSCRR